MKSILPRRFELLVFVAMAAVAGSLVAMSPQRDTMLFIVTGPVFLVAAILGFRRSLVPVPVKDQDEVRPDGE